MRHNLTDADRTRRCRIRALSEMLGRARYFVIGVAGVRCGAGSAVTSCSGWRRRSARSVVGTRNGLVTSSDMARREMRVPGRCALVAALAVALLAAGCDGEAADGGTTTTGPPPSITTAGSTTTATRSVDPTTTTMFPADPSEDAVWAAVPEVRDVTVYSEGLGITAEEAQHRNALVEAFFAGELSKWLDNRNGLYWVEESSEAWAVVVGRTRIPDAFIERVEQRVAGTPLEGLVEVRKVQRDLGDLRRAEDRIVELVSDWCLPRPTSLAIDYPWNQVVVGVQSVDEFVEAADGAGFSFRDFGAVAVEELPVAAPPGADTEPCEAPLRALAEARERWASLDLDRYAYRVTASSTWSGSVEVGEVLVWDGDVTEVLPPELTPGMSFYPPRFEIRYGMVERLFDIVESHPVQWMSATYDAEWGFPNLVSFDVARSIDEEWGFQVNDFRLLESVPEPAPPRASRIDDGLLEIERFFPREIAVVDAVIGPALGVYQLDNGWRHTIDVTSLVYRSPGTEPLDPGPVEVIDRVGFTAPRALLNRVGDAVRLLLEPLDGGWQVFAVLESTPDGLGLDGPLAQRGYSEELGYLCHSPRSDIPTDPPPQRNADAEFDLLLHWLDERGPYDPNADWWVTSKEALRKVCGEV